MLAAMTSFFLAAINLSPSTTKSLITIKITQNTGMKHLWLGANDQGNTRKIRRPLTSILSAIGSRNFPKSVTWFHFLAKYPSRKSVKEATINTIHAIRYTRLIPEFPRSGDSNEGITEQANKKTSKTATRTILTVVIFVGIFIFFPSFF